MKLALPHQWAVKGVVVEHGVLGYGLIEAREDADFVTVAFAGPASSRDLPPLRRPMLIASLRRLGTVEGVIK